MTFPPARTPCGFATGWRPAGIIRRPAGGGRTFRSSTIRRRRWLPTMKIGKMDGFCVGEPWNARSIADEIGFTAITTQQIWKDHPRRWARLPRSFG